MSVQINSFPIRLCPVQLRLLPSQALLTLTMKGLLLSISSFGHRWTITNGKPVGQHLGERLSGNHRRNAAMIRHPSLSCTELSELIKFRLHAIDEHHQDQEDQVNSSWTGMTKSGGINWSSLTRLVAPS